MTPPNAELPKVERGWNELSELVERLGPDGLARRDLNGWSVRDHVAHVAAWELSALGILRGENRIAIMGISGVGWDVEAINNAVWELHRHQTDAEVMAYCRNAHDSLVAALSNLSDADLQLPYSHYQPHVDIGPDGSRPVVEWMGGNTYEHYAEHIGWIDQLIKESSAAR